MKRLKIILIAAVAGAIAGILITRVRFHVDKAAVSQWQWRCSVILWVVFSLYWEVAARKTAENQSAESSASRAVHVTMTNAALMLVLVPLGVLPMAFAIPGLMLEAAGLALAIAARRSLGRYWSGEISIKVGHELVRTGPYRKLRHPIYVGLLAMYLGCAMVNPSWFSAIGFLLAVTAYARKIKLEEQNLQAAFGNRYEEYRSESLF